MGSLPPMLRQQQPALNVEPVALPADLLHSGGRVRAGVHVVRFLPMADGADLDFRWVREGLMHRGRRSRMAGHRAMASSPQRSRRSTECARSGLAPGADIDEFVLSTGEHSRGADARRSSTQARVRRARIPGVMFVRRAALDRHRIDVSAGRAEIAHDSAMKATACRRARLWASRSAVARGGCVITRAGAAPRRKK